jgi:hypothetical protein
MQAPIQHAEIDVMLAPLSVTTLVSRWTMYLGSHDGDIPMTHSTDQEMLL